MANVSYTEVNNAIKARGGKERLVHGFGKFYFVDGQASRWNNVHVDVPSITSLTLAEWLEQWQKLRSNLKPTVRAA